MQRMNDWQKERVYAARKINFVIGNFKIHFELALRGCQVGDFFVSQNSGLVSSGQFALPWTNE
jgi:hypothetical protein